MSQRFAISWLVIAIQIAGTWSLIHFAPPSIDTGVEVIIPGLHDCEADAEGRIDYDCMKRRTQLVEDYLAEHDIPGADQRHGPIVWIEALIALICGGVVFTFSQSRLSAAFAALIYLIAFAAAALGPPTLVGLLFAIALVWIGRRARKMAP